MKKITKVLALLLCVVMVAGLCACGSTPAPAETKAPAPAETKAPAESGTAEPETPAEPTFKFDGPITMIVNYSAGGGTDLAARALADAASEILGTPITVSNITGGSGTVGVTELANSKNDGYTIGVATLSPLAIMPWKLEVTYTPDDFDYICVYGQYGYGIVVPANSKYNTLDDLIADAQAGTVNFGATGYPQPLIMADLGAATNANFNFVSYSSTSDLVTDVLGGFIPCAMADYASFAAYVKSGDMKLLASAIETRWDCEPDVPTLVEMGYDLICGSYMGICAPVGIPAEALAVLQDAFAQASEDETYKQILKDCNLTWNYMTGDEYNTLVHEKYAEYQVALAE